MTVPYFWRLLCLCLGAFFLVQLAAGFAIARLAPLAIRMASRMRASHAAAFLFAVRLAPLAIALVVVAGFCAPSFLLLEPRAAGEKVGFGFLAAAMLGLAVCAAAVWRAARAIRSLAICQRDWKRNGTSEHFNGDSVLILREETPFLGLAGLFRPRMVVSRAVLDKLSSDELHAAMEHERAHLASRDNLKRLVLLLTPDPLPFWRGLKPLDSAWRRFTEWAADDAAVVGDAERSVSLAAALVHVARLSGRAVVSPLITPLLADSTELAGRVNRLLASTPSAPAGRAWPLPMLASAAILLTAFATRQPAALYWVHRTIERLVH
jgi:hypothetical protein